MADRGLHRHRWRIAGWGAAAALLLLPLIAMRFTDGVNWSAFDFLAAGTLIGGVGLAFELAVRRSGSGAYRAAAAIALLAAVLMIWINLAVGVIGSEENPANLMYAGVLAVAVLGALLARFAPAGMARAMLAAAAAQLAAEVVVLVAGLGITVPFTAFFGALWLASAWLFRKAARDQTAISAAATRRSSESRTL